jgi:hypothetical protein
MDADDLALPERLEKQRAFLEANPQIGIVGSAAELIDETGAVTGVLRFEGRPALVHWHLFFANVLIHPTVMMRRSVVEPLGYYQSALIGNEDYDLWLRASQVTQLANLPDVLLQYRVWGESITGRHSHAMEMASIELVRAHVEALVGRGVTSGEIRGIRYALPTDLSISERKQGFSLLGELYRSYVHMTQFTDDERRLLRKSAMRKRARIALDTRNLQMLFKALWT